MRKKILLLFPLLSILFSCSNSGGSTGIPLTVEEAATEVSAAAKKYDSSITADGLISDITKLDSSIDISSQCTFSNFFLLLESAFSSDLFPAKTGARLMEAYDNEENPQYSTYSEDSPYTKAFRFVTDAGLVNARYFDGDFYENTLIYQDDVWTILDRFHWYYGTSEVDDFYAYTNYDQRIANCEDEGTTSSESLIVSNLIPRKNINAWTKENLVNDNDSNSFYTVYLESLEGDSGLVVLRDYLEPLLASENIVTLVKNMISLHNTYGYAPLYLSNSWKFLTVGGEPCFAPVSSVFYNDATESEAKEGGSEYTRTLERFTPMFSRLLGSETEGEKYAKHYAEFKYLNVLSYKKNSELENEEVVIDEEWMLGNSGISLEKALGEIGYSNDHYWIVESERQATSYYDLFTNANLNAMKGYCVFETMRHFLVLLPEEDVFNQWVLGTSYEGKRSDHDTYYYQYVLPYYANDLVNHYAETDAYKEDVAIIKDLYDDLRETLVDKANNSSWLSKEGAAKVKEKSDNMKYFIGNTSDKSETHALLQTEYSSLTNPSLMDCVALYQRNSWSNNLKKVDNPPTDDFYYQASSYNPFTANAYYMPGRNGILITMGYITANKRPSLMSEEEFLSHFGWVVGHEIGHGFDTNGFKYDYEGKYNESWISEKDRSALSDFSEKFAAYFDGYETIPGFSTSGRIVLNEALADNIGLSLSLTIGKNNNFSIEEFFKQGAKAFGGYITRNYFSTNEYNTDSHPYGRCRINKAFGCFDEFHETFKTKEGDHMYVPEEERLVLY